MKSGPPNLEALWKQAGENQREKTRKWEKYLPGLMARKALSLRSIAQL